MGNANTPLRIAVLGVGRIGRMHAALLASQVRGASLAMVHDVQGDLVAEVGAEFGVPFTTDADEVFASDQVDAIAICSSTDTHIPLLHACAAVGKPVFCEKPIAQDLRAVDAVLAALDAAGVAMHVAFNRRFDPAHRAVREAVQNGSIGDVHIVRVTSRDPAPPPIAYVKSSGGMFLDMTIHDFDMARYICGSEVIDVTAHGAVLVDAAIGDAGDIDTAVVVLRHANGAMSVIDNSRQAVYGYDQRVEAFGSKGMAQSDNPPAHTSRLSTVNGIVSPNIPYFFLDRYIPAYINQWDEFVAAVRTGAAMPVDGAAGRAPLVIGLAAMRSATEHRTVTIAEIENSIR